jgi:hypothetical protein
MSLVTPGLTLQISEIRRTAAKPGEGVPDGWRSPRMRPRSIWQIGRLLYWSCIGRWCSSSSQQEQNLT